MKLDYTTRIAKGGYEGYDDIKFAMEIEVREGSPLTLINWETKLFWEEFGYDELEWEGWNEDPKRLSAELEDMGLDQDQADAAIVALLKKVHFAFEESGTSRDPCEIYMEHLLGYSEYELDRAELSIYKFPYL